MIVRFSKKIPADVMSSKYKDGKCTGVFLHLSKAFETVKQKILLYGVQNIEEEKQILCFKQKEKGLRIHLT